MKFSLFPPTLVRLLLLIPAGYFFVCAYLFVIQRQKLYYPKVRTEAEMAEGARAAGLERWRDPAGTPIGWQTRDGEGGAPILIFHGNGGNALDRVSLIGHLREAGISQRIHILDYPGFGSRPGTPKQTNLTAAACAALESMPSPPVVIGESLGTGVAAQAVSRNPEKVRGVILLVPFDSMANAAAFHYPQLPVRYLLLDRYDSVAALRNFRKPIAVIVAEKDDTTPPEGGLRLFQSLPGPKELRLIPDAGHGDTPWMLGPSGWRDIWRFVSDSPLKKQ